MDDTVQHKAANKGASKPRMPDKVEVEIIRVQLL